MKLEYKNIDVSKLDLGLRHEYVPTTSFNMSLNEKERMVIDCEYFRVGEKMSFNEVSADGTATMDFRKIFLKKVKGIRNFEFNGKPVTTSEEFLKFPGVGEMDLIVMNVVLHIINADELTEDEAKN